MSKTYDVVVKTARGSLLATVEGGEGVPAGLVLQAVMSHQQLIPHLTSLKANEADVILVTTVRRLHLPPGLTVVFSDGVNINGPVKPSPVFNVPREFDGVQLTRNTAVLVQYTVDPEPTPAEDPPEDDEFPDYDTEY